MSLACQSERNMPRPLAEVETLPAFVLNQITERKQCQQSERREAEATVIMRLLEAHAS